MNSLPSNSGSPVLQFKKLTDFLQDMQAELRRKIPGCKDDESVPMFMALHCGTSKGMNFGVKMNRGVCSTIDNVLRAISMLSLDDIAKIKLKNLDIIPQ